MCLVIAAAGLAACGDNGGNVTASMGSAASMTTQASDPGSSGDVTGTPTTGASASSSGGASDSATGSDPSTGGGTTTTGGIKFDVGEDTSATGGGQTGPGSCRPSEIYGASGAAPKFTDPAYASFLGKTVLVVTSNTQEDQYVLHVLDISGPPPPPNMNYLAPRYNHPSWLGPNLGRIFGLTLDSYGNIYVAPSTVYGPNPNPATIKRIDGITGAITDFATLPNNGPALGNINYDCVSQTIYASNHEDGRIYQIDMAGKIVSTYHHATGNVTMGPPSDPGEPDGAFAPLGARIWAVQSHAGRLYYSVWWEDSGRQSASNENEIWSVAYADEAGIPDPATKKLEIQVPGLNGATYSNPISDLSFAATGWMLISERTMLGDDQTLAHQSTTYEYDYNAGVWEPKGTTFVVGELPNSAAGGVDHDFAPGGYVWMTGDALDFYTPEVVYGVQGTPHGGGDITNSTLIDLDNEVTGQDKTAQGDVEIPIPDDAKPVPPPA